jgi:hypothetical protein
MRTMLIALMLVCAALPAWAQAQFLPPGFPPQVRSTTRQIGPNQWETQHVILPWGGQPQVYLCRTTRFKDGSVRNQCY